MATIVQIAEQFIRPQNITIWKFFVFCPQTVNFSNIGSIYSLSSQVFAVLWFLMASFDFLFF